MPTLKTELNQITTDLNEIEAIINAGNVYQEAVSKLKGKGKALRSLENDTSISDDTVEVLANRTNDLIRNLVKASSSYNFTKKSFNELKGKLEEAQAQARSGAK
ncbi:hypothetical protein IAE51_03665 [Lactococcus sp. S64]|uniref:Uncharacterized protein n=1 Tax=Lactococcus lactis subsp. lactis TaxID=1360 RepID=A0A0V8E7H3_LACLL|nr:MULTISPECIES: hypothetical protein [Lactococcus]KSU21792.1 hypothetical protein M20_0838 [Lactococcus lactis subsp. lactis]MBK0083021.1 hypothetical protein [Lactococcus sp. S64]MCT0016765.1 hypothetical protein [Lactococcus lactis subsp. lactis]MCT0055564.1 hypothetical protein [Lactococcus lactis subsp. lactis]MDG4965496.1 hypothetical protein [Lactococcus lactis]